MNIVWATKGQNIFIGYSFTLAFMSKNINIQEALHLNIERMPYDIMRNNFVPSIRYYYNLNGRSAVIVKLRVHL